MSENLEDHIRKAPRKPKLKLPFDNRREDAGTWAYDHRVGLCVTLIAYLLLMIVFVSSKIVVGRRASQQGMYIDLQTLAELEQERDRLQAEVDRRQQGEAIDWGSIRNEISNENALNEQLKDDRGTNAAALNDAAEDAAARMQANREAYEQGLAEAEAIGGDRGRASEGKHEDRKVRGSVTVSFSLTDPLRQSVHLNVPAYRCESGGQVVVAIVVNRAGEVISARVVEGGDDCMREAALRAANISTFNIDPAAPARHQGTITYTFIPQYGSCPLSATVPLCSGVLFREVLSESGGMIRFFGGRGIKCAYFFLILLSAGRETRVGNKFRPVHILIAYDFDQW